MSTEYLTAAATAAAAADMSYTRITDKIPVLQAHTLPNVKDLRVQMILYSVHVVPV